MRLPLYFICCVVLLFSAVAVYAEENISSIDKEKKEKKQKNKADDGVEGAAAKGDFVIQPAINFGFHSGFVKQYSGFGYGYAYTGLIPGVTLNLDYAAHDYASVGLYYGVSFQKFTVSKVSLLHHTFGARVQFHWWQMLADRSGKELLADKIDFDIHAHIGGYYLTEKNLISDQKLKHLGVNAGGGIGFKYYFVKHFGVALDAGYEEASWLKLGLAIKI
ncbi:MAG TPA: hypothetical protein PKD39_09775 [Chitinophagales bacterium]|nr:hypothetical protein [Chitinophagales bacterium]HMX60868.1 hypothetical protein [Chitinophagales bacterium]HMY22510.1 hypothetical protein [Chitinophagales bacterium]HMZ34506.1 hypothetical protein [Chitinophagales bacterium]HNF50699.1 hypothetical protein [Chitinophagales bacterium]